jgi:hypothetical protein
MRVAQRPGGVRAVARGLCERRQGPRVFRWGPVAPPVGLAA